MTEYVISYGGDLSDLGKEYEGYTRYGLLDEIRQLKEKNNRQTELLKQAYLAFMRFDNALNAQPLNTHEINVAYAWLDSVMSHIYDEVGSELGVDKLPPLEESEGEEK